MAKKKLQQTNEDQLDDEFEEDDDETSDLELRDEKRRQRKIRALCSLDDRTESLADKLIEDGVSIEEARRRILDHMRQVNPARGSPRRVEFGEDQRDKFTSQMELSLRARAGQKLNDQEKAIVQTITHPGSLRELAALSLKQAGVSTAGLFSEQIVTRAIAHSTSDYPKILENVMGKALLQGWSEAPATWRPLVKVISANDFKVMARTKLGDSGDLVLTPELAPMAEGTIPEAGEKYSIATYSKRFGISRQSLINDDLAAFDSIPRLMGAAAARVPAKLFYDLLLSASGVGPTMSEDGKALFATDHPSGANYTAGTGAPDVAGLAIGFKLMRSQKGLAGAGETAPILNISPTFLLVPANLEVQGRQTLTAIVPNSVASANPFASAGLTLIVEPRLDGGTNGSTAWFLIASPGQFPGAEMAFLNGQEAPTTIREEGTNILGVEMGVYLDVGCKFVEHRPFYRCRGA